MLRMIGVGDNVVDCYPQSGKLYPGGNSVNFAVYARQLGCFSAYLGVLADDREAGVITEALTHLGVGLSHCAQVHGETGRCTTILREGDRIITDDNDFGAVKAFPLQLTPERLEYIEGFDVAHSSCYSFLENQLYKIKEAGVPLVYDFSDCWTESDFETVCPSLDIAFFSGKKLPEGELRRLLQKAVGLGCSLAICTAGKRGAMVFNGRRFFTAAPYHLEASVVDTLGAGDSFLTGFVSAYYEGKKRYNALVGEQPERFTTEENRAAYADSLTEYSINAGNLLAIKNCMVSGAFGCSAPL